jgi:hypothetical protein
MDHEMDPERVARVASRLAEAERDPQQRLCGASAAIVRVSGAGIVLMSQGKTLGNLCASNAFTQTIEDVQFAMGEGPCVDASRTKAPVLVPNLAEVAATHWPGFREAASTAGACAAFGFPLLVGSVCIGALDLYPRRTGDLSDDQFANAIVVAHLVGRILLGWQSAAPEGALAWQLEQVPAHRAVVHQATGMVSVQAGLSLDDALMLIRAHAFAEGRRIDAVARDIVDRLLRLE